MPFPPSAPIFSSLRDCGNVRGVSRSSSLQPPSGGAFESMGAFGNDGLESSSRSNSASVRPGSGREGSAPTMNFYGPSVHYHYYH